MHMVHIHNNITYMQYTHTHIRKHVYIRCAYIYCKNKSSNLYYISIIFINQFVDIVLMLINCKWIVTVCNIILLLSPFEVVYENILIL